LWLDSRCGVYGNVDGIDVNQMRSRPVHIKAADAARRKSEMTGSDYRFARARRPALIATACLLMAAGLAGTAALGQDQSAAPPADTIIARKTVMDTLSSKMDALEAATASTKKIDLAAASEQADTVSVLLMAFPHMFPAATNQWKPNVDKDPGTDTFAAPEVWTRYADFYKQATAASKLAFDASRATREAEFRTTMAQLRTACDGCHAAYMKTD
jgi:cytochrome c556